MLEKLEELIGKICSDTSVAKADFQQGYGYGYSFSSYNTDFFTAWEMSGYYRFSWSERRPSRRFTMDTRNDTLASYVLITQVGALRRARLRQRPIVIPGEAPSPQQWTIADTRWPRVKRYTSAADPTMVVESVEQPRAASDALRHAVPAGGLRRVLHGPGRESRPLSVSLLCRAAPGAPARRGREAADRRLLLGMSWSFLLRTRRAAEARQEGTPLRPPGNTLRTQHV